MSAAQTRKIEIMLVDAQAVNTLQAIVHLVRQHVAELGSTVTESKLLTLKYVVLRLRRGWCSPRAIAYLVQDVIGLERVRLHLSVEAYKCPDKERVKALSLGLPIAHSATIFGALTQGSCT